MRVIPLKIYSCTLAVAAAAAAVAPSRGDCGLSKVGPVGCLINRKRGAIDTYVRVYQYVCVRTLIYIRVHFQWQFHIARKKRIPRFARSCAASATGKFSSLFWNVTTEVSFFPAPARSHSYVYS